VIESNPSSSPKNKSGKLPFPDPPTLPVQAGITDDLSGTPRKEGEQRKKDVKEKVRVKKVSGKNVWKLFASAEFPVRL